MVLCWCMISWKSILAVAKPNITGVLISSIPVHQYPHCAFPKNQWIGSKIQENILIKGILNAKTCDLLRTIYFLYEELEWNEIVENLWQSTLLSQYLIGILVWIVLHTFSDFTILQKPTKLYGRIAYSTLNHNPIYVKNHWRQND